MQFHKFSIFIRSFGTNWIVRNFKSSRIFSRLIYPWQFFLFFSVLYDCFDQLHTAMCTHTHVADRDSNLFVTTASTATPRRSTFLPIIPFTYQYSTAYPPSPPPKYLAYILENFGFVLKEGEREREKGIGESHKS